MVDPRCTCGNTTTFQKHDWWCKARNPEEPSMTKEQDIVERLENPNYAKSPTFAASYMREAGQTIDALRAERDDARKEIERWHNVAMKAGAITHSDGRHSYPLRARAEAAEARVKELEGDRDNYRELLQASIANAKDALRERDDALKALEPFAKEADHWDDIPGVVKTHDNVELWQNPNHRTPITVGDLRRARSASSNREGGEE